MNSQPLRRATATLAALGTLLALVLVGLTSTGAQAAPRCRPGYPASVATTTRLSAPVFARVGRRVVAHASVSSSAGRPSGSLVIHVPGNTVRGSASGVSAGFRVNRRGTYRISASYGGGGCYKPSSASRRITVFARGGDRQTHFGRLSARSVHRGGHPHVSGRIVKASGAGASGRARIRVSFHGHVRFTRTVRLHRGAFSASFPSVRQVGVWTASVTGGGTSGSVSFRVRR